MGYQTRMVAPGLWLTVPDYIVPADVQNLDSRATTLSGGGFTIFVDEGPFSDPVTRYAGQPGYEVSTENINGTPARMVSFEDEEGCGIWWPGSRAWVKVEFRGGSPSLSTCCLAGISPSLGMYWRAPPPSHKARQSTAHAGYHSAGGRQRGKSPANPSARSRQWSPPKWVIQRRASIASRRSWPVSATSRAPLPGAPPSTTPPPRHCVDTSSSLVWTRRGTSTRQRRSRCFRTGAGCRTFSTVWPLRQRVHGTGGVSPSPWTREPRIA